jgi:hypothetical protein
MRRYGRRTRNDALRQARAAGFTELLIESDRFAALVRGLDS